MPIWGPSRNASSSFDLCGSGEAGWSLAGGWASADAGNENVSAVTAVSAVSATVKESGRRYFLLL